MPSHAAIAWCHMIITIMQATWHKSDWHVDKPQKTFDACVPDCLLLLGVGSGNVTTLFGGWCII